MGSRGRCWSGEGRSVGGSSLELVVEEPDGGEDEGGVKEISELKPVERDEVGVRGGMELGEPPNLLGEEQDIIDLEGVYLRRVVGEKYFRVYFPF